MGHRHGLRRVRDRTRATEGGSIRCSWDEIQKIKDELIGPEERAIEVYPRASELVFDAPIRHFWVVPASVTLPNLTRRARTDGPSPLPVSHGHCDYGAASDHAVAELVVSVPDHRIDLFRRMDSDLSLLASDGGR